MRRLRLLMVSSDTFPPTRVDVAVLFGVEMRKRHHQIDVIMQSEAACASPYVTTWGGGDAWVGATDLGNSLLSRLRKHIRGIYNDGGLFSRLRSGRYDVVQVKDKFLSGVFALIASRLFRTRYVFWLSYPFPEHYLLRASDGTARYPILYRLRGLAFKVLLYRLLLPAADHVFVQSEQMRVDVAAEGIPLQKTTAVPMGIGDDLCNIPDLTAGRTVLPNRTPCVLYLGTLDRVRRLDFLIRVFDQVKSELPDALLYLVGRGEHPDDEAFLRREVARLQLQSSVIFVGQLPQAAALQYVQEADVCVSPFFPTPILRSASPTKLVEYLAMGKAVVANDHPEQRRVIDESGAGICVAWDESTFAAAILGLLRDPEEARAMGQRGRAYVRQHRSYGVIADKVESRLRDVVEGRC
jgi:glycosyltransferase involved in cell wall biosynthesis